MLEATLGVLGVQGLDAVIRERRLQHLAREYGVFRLLESALVFLAINGRWQSQTLLLEEGLRYARALRGRNLEALPILARSPRLVEAAPPAVGRREHHQRAPADRQHRARRVIQTVVHP